MLKTDTNVELIHEDYGLGLTKAFNARLKAIGEDNSRAICDYVKCFDSETRLSISYKRLTATILFYASEFSNNKKFKEMTKDDNLVFLNSLRKSEDIDPLHGWVSTYNTYRPSKRDRWANGAGCRLYLTRR